MERTYEDLMALVGSVAEVTEKQSINLGGLLSRVDDLTGKVEKLQNSNELMLGVSNKVNNIQEDVISMNNRMEQIELNEEVTTEQKEGIRSACRARIYDILGGDPDTYARYYRIFAQRLWSDMRKNCGLGSKIEETHKRDYQRILNGIEAWYPIGGVQKLKDRCDANAKARLEAKHNGYI